MTKRNLNIKLLISPLAQGAYFAEYEKVAMAELLAHLPDAAPHSETLGSLSFLCLEAQHEYLPMLARWCQNKGVMCVMCVMCLDGHDRCVYRNTVLASMR